MPFRFMQGGVSAFGQESSIKNEHQLCDKSEADGHMRDAEWLMVRKFAGSLWRNRRSHNDWALAMAANYAKMPACWVDKKRATTGLFRSERI